MRYDWSLIGHQKQLEHLENDLSSSSLSHAYFFHGPKGVGKFTLAKRFSKRLLCPNGRCQACRDCRMIDSGLHPDFIHLIDEGETIKIDHIRELSRKVSLSTQGKRRVVLIDNLERMPVEAQNAFLKTLEEPPEGTFFLLTASRPKKVLPTILSRVRQQEFGLVEEARLKEVLQKKYGNPPQLDMIVDVAQGRPGVAIQLLDQPEEWAAHQHLTQQIQQFLTQNNVVAKFVFVETLDKDPLMLERFFEVFCHLLRKAVNDFASDKPHSLKERFSLGQLTELFEKLVKTRYLTQRNVNKKLALENLLLSTEK